MDFFVFSYNRGPFLRNCVESIERCAPDAGITVYDDESDDPETVQILRLLSARYNVVHGKHDAANPHGGLYSNMQAAYDSLDNEHIVCFLQDDTQLVRPITADDMAFIERYFSEHPECGFLAPVFLRRITKQKTLARFEYDPGYGVYFCRHQNDKCAGVYYSDIFVSTAERLREAGWRFQQSELENEQQARECFGEMGYMYAPFMMWLPNGPAFRNREKPLAYRLAEKQNRCGCYPFRYMAEHDIERLKGRPPSERPIAEDFLDTVDTGLEKPWIYHPLKRSRLLRKFYKIESFIRSFR